MRPAVSRRAPQTPARKDSPRRAGSRQIANRRRLAVEALEPRTLLALAPADDPLSSLSGHGGLCNCPVCTGVGLEQIAVVSDTSAPLASATALSGIPQLSSNPAARAKLYLDFSGHTQASWGTYSGVVTPAFDQDGNRSSLTSGEAASIREIWARVAEDYAPFNIDVTTIDPGSLADGRVAHVAIGGNWSDWYGSSAGGVAYVGGFANGMPNVAYVFEDALGNGNPRYVAEAAAHEAGHLFGLQHQAVWNGGTLVEPYNSGSGNWAPIMGTGYYAERTTWHRGTSSAGASAVQDDMAIIAGAANGFGWRADDFGNTTSTATPLSAAGTIVHVSGLVGNPSDVDMWSFSTGGGVASFQLSGAARGGNLDGVLELRDAGGRTIATSAPATTLGATLSASLTRGTYYLVARSQGGYGNAGQYAIRGSLPAATSTAAPEIGIQMQGLELADASAVSFGTTTVGTAITRTFTITNKGTATLALTPLSTSGWPAGFSLASNLGRTSLSPGQSTSFSIRFSAASAGTTSGQITVRSSDANEAAFDLRLSATAVALANSPMPPTTTSTSSTLVKRVLDNGAAGHSRSTGWTRLTDRGVQSDIDQSAKGNGTNYSTWSFPGLPNGVYQIYASWTGSSTAASNAPFTLYNGSTPVVTVRANQRVASSGLVADGASWRFLGNVTITAGRLNVRLSNAADGAVLADAIRIVQTKTLAAGAAARPASADAALLAILGDDDETAPPLPRVTDETCDIVDAPEAVMEQLLAPAAKTAPTLEDAIELLASDRRRESIAAELADIDAPLFPGS